MGDRGQVLFFVLTKSAEVKCNKQDLTVLLGEE